MTVDLRAVIFDYGCVLCRDQPAADRARIEALAGIDGRLLWPAYWRHREAYDRGQVSGQEFWGLVGADAGRPLGARLRAELVDADIASWSHLDGRMVAWLEALAAAGYLVGLLSNAPAEMRDVILGRLGRFDWAGKLTVATFSCDVAAVKPEPAIYRHCLAGLGVEPAAALFIDDRAANVDGALRVGMRALRYVDAGELSKMLAGIDGLPPLPG